MPQVRIVPIHHAPLNIAKSYLLVGDRVVIVDTGPPDQGRRGERVRRALAECGRSHHDVSLVLVTHAHPDHVGNAVALRAWTSAPIALDPREAAFVEGRDTPGQTPTGISGRIFLHTPLPHQEFDFFTADIWVDEQFDLRRFGVDAVVHRWGGHTPGSLAIHVPECRALIAADLLAGGIGIGGIAFHGRVIDPPFHEDRAAVMRATAELLAIDNLETVHVCHGGPLTPGNIARWFERERRRLGSQAFAPPTFRR